MKSQLTGAGAVLSAALVLGACAYDPYYYGAYGHGQYIDQEEHSFRDRLGDEVDIRREGGQLHLHILGDVLFTLDSAKLRSHARALIGSIAAELTRYNSADVDV